MLALFVLLAVSCYSAFAFSFHASSFPFSDFKQRHGQRQQRSSQGSGVVMKLSPLPTGGYNVVYKQAQGALKQAFKDGLDKLEVEFPPVQGKIDISLGETLDGNSRHVRELIRPFTATQRDGLWLVFPDNKEAKLAREGPTFGGKQPFTVTSIEGIISLGPEGVEGRPRVSQWVLNPGFNVDEYENLDKCHAGPEVPMVVLNGNLDRVRDGYYPRIFYGGVFKAKERFLGKFEQAYYLKPLPGRGWLFRVYPEPWQIVVDEPGTKPVVVQSLEGRPSYNSASQSVKEYNYERSVKKREEEQAQQQQQGR